MLATITTQFVNGLLEPFGVAFSPDGRYAFVDSIVTAQSSTAMRSPSGITIYSVGGNRLNYDRVGTFPQGSLIGMAVSTRSGLLAAANQSGASVFSLSRMEQAKSAPSSWLLGSLTSEGEGAIEAAFSPDGDFLFVTLEDSREMAVFNVEYARLHGFGHRADLVGYVPLGLAPVGMAISADGRYLYVTSESGTAAGTQGTLSTVDLRTAERNPSKSVISTVWAGCNPVRVAASKSSVYVTARASDDLLQFSADRLIHDPRSALTGEAAVGELPVGLALVDHGEEVIVADSNRLENRNDTSSLAVVSTSPGTPLRLIGYLPAGGFPRDMALSPNGESLVVSNFDSGQVEDVRVTDVPERR